MQPSTPPLLPFVNAIARPAQKPQAWIKIVRRAKNMWIRVTVLQLAPQSLIPTIASRDYIRTSDSTIAIIPNEEISSRTVSRRFFEREITRLTNGAEEIPYLAADERAQELLSA